jgi:hypothetical protein
MTGFLCCVGLGCGHESGDDFRTYEQTLSDAAPPEGSLDAETAPTPDPELVAAADPPAPAEPEGTESQIVTQEDGGGDVAGPPDGATGEVVVEPAPTLPADAPPERVTDTDPVTTVAATDPREIELLVPENEFQTEGPEGAVRVSYNDIDLLKVLNMEPVPRSAPSYFPEWLTALDGERIRIRGFMYPPPVETGIPVFLLARDNQICCFGKNPMPYDIIPVILRDDVTTDYINGRPFDVVGLFHIGVEMNLDDPTKVKTVYYIDDAIVIDE